MRSTSDECLAHLADHLIDLMTERAAVMPLDPGGSEDA